MGLEEPKPKIVNPRVTNTLAAIFWSPTLLEFVAGMDGILTSPAGGSEQGIEAIRTGSGISIRDNLSPESSGLDGVRHPPFDHRRIKGYFEFLSIV
jgi:hypothetical protein